jgi:biopolymer transport protein TolR
MGFGTHNNGSGKRSVYRRGRGGGSGGYSAGGLPEINITPFVDVLLVLLIVFMAASPALVSGLNINLPKAGHNSEIDTAVINITLSVTNSGEIFVNDKPCQQDQLATALSSIAKDKSKATIFLRGDRDLVYDKIMNHVNLLAKEGFENIVLVTDNG